jgi:hypothetical protein
MGEMNVHKILVRNPSRTRPFRRPSHEWEDNIRMYLKKIAQDRNQWWDPVNQ